MILTDPKAFENLKAGDVVYGVIKWDTLNLFTPHYRPLPYFVLETRVKRIRPDMKQVAEFDTGFLITKQRAFTELNEAKRHLMKVFTEETGGILPFEKVKVVTREDEIRETDAIDLKVGATAQAGQKFLHPLS